MKKTILSVTVLLGLLVGITFSSFVPAQIDLADHGSEYTGR